MKGGLRWKQGQDVCVLKPSVACLEDPEHPGAIPDMISRMVQPKSEDELNEKILKEKFPALAKRGFVVVYDHACLPLYSSRNTKKNKNLPEKGPCMRLTKKHINLITPEYTDTYYNYAFKKNKLTFPEALELIRGAICAAIELVPDSGTWLVHGDIHIGNVLVKEDTKESNPDFSRFSALADWGRIITFDSNNDKSIKKGLQYYLELQSKKFGPFPTYLHLASFPNIAAGKFPQFSVKTLVRVHEFLTLPNEINKQTAINALRGCVVYALLKQVYYAYPAQALPANFTDLLKTNNQNELITMVNTMLPQIRGEDYYTKRYVQAQKDAGAEPPSNAIGAGAGAPSMNAMAASNANGTGAGAPSRNAGAPSAAVAPSRNAVAPSNALGAGAGAPSTNAMAPSRNAMAASNAIGAGAPSRNAVAASARQFTKEPKERWEKILREMQEWKPPTGGAKPKTHKRKSHKRKISRKKRI